MNLCTFTGRACSDSNGCADYVGGPCAHAAQERDTAFVPLRSSGELPVMFVGPEPDNWSRISRWARNAVWAALTLAALAVTLWVAARWPL